jgi:hypothetical protein
MGLAAMYRIARDYENLTGKNHERLTGHDKLIRTLEHIHDLFMRMTVLGQDRARLDRPVYVGRVLRMDEPAVVSGDEFACVQ